MATKVTHVEAMAAMGQEMYFEITGARFVQDHDGKVEIALAGVTPTEIDWQAVEELVIQAGIDQDEAPALTELIARTVNMHLLAKVLVKRLRRVG